MTGATRPGSEAPRLTIVVTIVESGSALRRFLAAVRSQTAAPPLEVLVPWDDTVAEIDNLRAEFPEVTWLALGSVRMTHPVSTAAGQHELYDRRRAAGLAAATGDLIAILEDRGAPREDWAATAVRLHREHPFGVIGGAIEPEPSSLLNWAFWVCDFSRYGPPFESGPARWVSDVNVTYKRSAIEETRPLWRDRYQEPVVHWALLDRGDTLYLSAELVVRHRLAPLRLGPLLPQRFDWGQLFGAIQARHNSLLKRLARVVMSPLIPLVVLARHGRLQARRGDGARFVRAIPILLVLLVAWTAGETWGQLSGRD